MSWTRSLARTPERAERAPPNRPYNALIHNNVENRAFICCTLTVLLLPIDAPYAPPSSELVLADPCRPARTRTDTHHHPSQCRAFSSAPRRAVTTVASSAHRRRPTRGRAAPSARRPLRRHSTSRPRRAVAPAAVAPPPVEPMALMHSHSPACCPLLGAAGCSSNARRVADAASFAVPGCACGSSYVVVFC